MSVRQLNTNKFIVWSILYKFDIIKLYNFNSTKDLYWFL
jgi:hypothetical protein